jgi:hypothetical protein
MLWPPFLFAGWRTGIAGMTVATPHSIPIAPHEDSKLAAACILEDELCVRGVGRAHGIQHLKKLQLFVHHGFVGARHLRRGERAKHL